MILTQKSVEELSNLQKKLNRLGTHFEIFSDLHLKNEDSQKSLAMFALVRIHNAQTKGVHFMSMVKTVHKGR